MHPVPRISKADPKRLLDFLTRHQFTDVENARRLMGVAGRGAQIVRAERRAA